MADLQLEFPAEEKNVLLLCYSLVSGLPNTLLPVNRGILILNHSIVSNVHLIVCNACILKAHSHTQSELRLSVSAVFE
jgi:hypothetical protein